MYTNFGDKMFNTDIISKVYELKELIMNSKEYKMVKETERLMEEKCSLLLIKYNNIFNEYNQALRFKDYGSDVSKVQKELNNVKLELDQNEYVKEYKKAYKNMNKLLNEIQNNMFKGIIENKDIVI